MARIMTRPAPDPAAVARAVAGRPPKRLTITERAAAVAELNRQGLSDPMIADRVGCTDRTVFRIRKRNGIPAAARGPRRPRGVA